MRLQGRRLLLVPAIGALVAAGAWASAPRTAGLSAAPRWQTLPTNIRTYPPFTEPFYAAGWVWFLVHRETGKSTMLSARVRGRALAAFTTSPIANTGLWTLVGSSLVYNPPNGSRARSVPLLANGKVGAPGALPGDPEETVLGAFPSWRGTDVVAGARVGSRTVWALSGGEPGPGVSVKATLAVCCTATGQATDLTPMITDRRWGTRDHHLGVDGRGRLWLSWSDSKNNPSRDPRLKAHMVELDPATLAPSGSKVLDTTTGDTRGLIFTCAASCRLVVFPLTGTFTWAPGEASPTKIAGRAKRVTSAGYRSGKLAISYYSTARSGYVARAAAAQGDARGRNPRDRSSIRPPPVFGPAISQFFQSGPPLAASTPTGAVVVVGYDTHQGRARALVAFLPLSG
jgi:hypothetical protein